MAFKFESLEIWHLAMDFAEDMQILTKKYPKEEKYNLTDQSNRASDSIAINISEGTVGQSINEQKRFIGYSIRSIAESVTCLFKARRRKYISDNEFKEMYDKAEILAKKVTAFRNNTKPKFPLSIFYVLLYILYSL